MFVLVNFYEDSCGYIGKEKYIYSKFIFKNLGGICIRRLIELNYEI